VTEDPDGATPAPDARAAQAESDSPATANTAPRAHHRARPTKRLTFRVYQRRRRIVWGLVIAACCLILAGAWVGFRLWQAHDHLEATAGLVAELQQNPHRR
jgi:type VI protein secretion system component VasF